MTVNNRFSRQNSIQQQPIQTPRPEPEPHIFRLAERRGRGSDEESMGGESQRQLVYGVQDSRFESTDSIIKLKNMV